MMQVCPECYQEVELVKRNKDARCLSCRVALEQLAKEDNIRRTRVKRKKNNG